MVRKEAKLAAATGDDDGALTVTAQQSRFHLDAVDAPTSKEVLIKDLSISVGLREIISHAELFLKEGGHYVLIGRNGTGKSTLLRAMANGLIPGIPWSLRILLLGQTRELDEELSKLQLEEQTVLQHVVSSDAIRERYVREARILSKALDHNDSLSAVKAVRELSHARLERRTAESRQIAQRRSGARGLKARKAQIALEEELVASQARLDADLLAIDSDELSKETKQAADMLSEIQSALEMMNASAASSKARTVLLGLGFSVEMIEKPTSRLSGGWQTRCELACALCQTADVLLLDEPTNFLDLPSIIWLQQYIINMTTTTVVVVTHDRDFADAVGEELMVLRNLVLEKFKGTLSGYEAERFSHIKHMTRMKDAQDRQKKHMESSVENNLKAAKRSGDDKKLKQAVSRKKKIDDRMGMQISAKGTRFKLNRDLAGYYLTSRAEIEIPKFDLPARLAFPMEPADLRFPGALVSLENISLAYKSAKNKPILTDISLTIHPGSRTAICGLNGSGKTTLVSLITGVDESFSSSSAAPSLSPTKGTITRHPRARLARFSQQAVEHLSAIATQDPTLTALSHLQAFTSNALTEPEARKVLGALGLQGAVASDVPLFALSGGQKVRLALAKLVWEAPHLLILDEVTTHLDSESIEGLIKALKGYQGAVLVVSHDRFFVRCVVEGESVVGRRADGEEAEEEESSDEEEGVEGVVYRLFKGKLRRLEGGMGEYEGIAERAAGKMKVG